MNLKKKCKECGCRVCGGKEEPNSQIMCDECSGEGFLPRVVLLMLRGQLLLKAADSWLF